MESIDFAVIKNAVTVEQAARWLGLELKPNGQAFRCACPVCKQGGERCIVITPEKRAWYDFSLKKGGDVIAMTAHVRGIGQLEAAKLLQQTFMQEPEKPRRKIRSTKPKKPVGGIAEPEREWTIVDYLQQFA